ncbi:hypothetical protein NU219Hw_g1977t1 [Hortaea werneckii]
MAKAIAPKPEEVHTSLTTPAASEYKARRILTRNACMRCRARKAKCNGKRPSCQSCLAKGLNCVYDIACEDITKMQSLQSRLEDMEKQLGSRTAELESCMDSIRRLQHATEGEADDLLARFRAGQNINEPPDTQRSSAAEHASLASAITTPKGRLPPTPESLEDVSDGPPTHQKRRRSRLATSVSTLPERDSAEWPNLIISHPKKQERSLWSHLGISREPSITQLCPFGSHLSIMQWESNLTAQFDTCLHAGISALSPAHRAKGRSLLSRPAAVDITSDGLLYQISGLLAVTSSDHRHRHFQTWPMLNWTRYNVLGALRTAISNSNEGSHLLAFIVAILTGWERIHGDPAAFQIHLSALQEMTVKGGGGGALRSSEPPPLDAGRVNFSSLPAAARLPDGFRHLRGLGLLPDSLLDLIARLDPTRLLHNDDDKQVNMDEWRRVSILLVALKPTSQTAIHALLHDGDSPGVPVTECVRFSALMFITLVLAVTDNDTWNQPMLSAIEPTYSDTHSIAIETLLGSVYDEVLLWSLCVFYALAGRLIERQLICFRRLLRAFMIPAKANSWRTLQLLMKRYLYHPYFDRRLREMMEIEERRAARDG